MISLFAKYQWAFLKLSNAGENEEIVWAVSSLISKIITINFWWKVLPAESVVLTLTTYSFQHIKINVLSWTFIIDFVYNHTVKFRSKS